jgi:O-antigen/teichoic acid export membrane protein
VNIIKKNNLLMLHPSIYAATAHGLRMCVNLLILKMIAMFAGPTGMAILGHFMSLTTMVSVFAGGGIGNGITKYVAEYRGNPRRMINFISASTVYGFCISCLILLLCIIFASSASILLFGNTQYAWLFPCLGIAHLFCFIGTGIIAIINGLQRSDLFAAITIISYLGCLPITYFLISNLGLEGAAISLLLVSACTGVSALFLIAKSRLTRMIRFQISYADARRLLEFTLMLLASATLFPLAEILIRALIMQSLGNHAAGIWQAMARLSGAYLGFFTVYLATNYMPKLSTLIDRIAIFDLVIHHLVIIFFLFTIFACSVYSLREYIIVILFTSAFNEISEFLSWQLLGDLFRVSSYVIGFLGVAKAAVRIYIASEFIQSSLYSILSTIVLLNGGGLREVVQVYALTYFIYFSVTVIFLYIYRQRLI